MESPDKSCEPMDIDLSSNSGHEMDISYNESVNEIKYFEKRENICATPVPNEFDRECEDITPKHKFKNLKKYHINKHEVMRTDLGPKTITILSIILAVSISIVIYYIFDVKCGDLSLEHLRDTLSRKVYGQTEAMIDIAEILEAKVESRILLFTGSTGVGKTYAASLILENTGFSSNVYHYTMPSFENTFTTDLMLGLTFCKTSVVVVDDLSIEDIQAKSHIHDIVLKAKALEKNITIILIYNCDNTAGSFVKKCGDNFHTQLLDKYKDVGALKKIIQFKPLTEDCLIKCIENELGSRRIHEQDKNRLLKNFNVSLDGCKGVHTKIKFLNII